MATTVKSFLESFVTAAEALLDGDSNPLFADGNIFVVSDIGQGLRNWRQSARDRTLLIRDNGGELDRNNLDFDRRSMTCAIISMGARDHMGDKLSLDMRDLVDRFVDGIGYTTTDALWLHPVSDSPGGQAVMGGMPVQWHLVEFEYEIKRS